MTFFWIWLVRNPALLGAGVGLGLVASGVAEAPGFVLVAFSAIVASLANHFGRRRRDRARQVRLELEAIRADAVRRARQEDEARRAA